jgi:serine protease Do
VDPTSPSAEAGLHAGEVIESINRHPVKNADEAVQLTEHGSGKTLVRVWDRNGSHYVVVDETKQTG